MVLDIVWKVDSYLACRRIACFLYGIRRFITMFIKARHRILSWSSRVHFFPSFFHCLARAKKSVLLRGSLTHFVTYYFFTVRCCYPTPNPQAGGSPLVGCPQLLIQYINSHPPYLEIFSSIRSLRARHAMVTGTHLIWQQVVNW
jgi:hypothetical protein